MIKMFDSLGKKLNVSLIDSTLFVNDLEKGLVENIYLTIYSSGDLITISKYRNYINLHLYNYLYEIFIKTNSFEYIFYTENKRKIFNEFMKDEYSKNKAHQIRFVRTNILPVVELENDDLDKNLIYKIDLSKNQDVLLQKLPKLCFHEIEVDNKKNIDIEMNYFKFCFSMRSITRIFYLGWLFLSLFFLTVIIIFVNETNIKNKQDLAYGTQIIFFVLLLMILIIFIFEKISLYLYKKK